MCRASFRRLKLELPDRLPCCRMKEVTTLKGAAQVIDRIRASIYAGGLIVPIGGSAPFAMRPVIMQT